MTDQFADAPAFTTVCQKITELFGYLDQGSPAAAVGLFTEDGIFDMGVPDRPALNERSETLAAFERRDSNRVTRHFWSNLIVTQDGANLTAHFQFASHARPADAVSAPTSTTMGDVDVILVRDPKGGLLFQHLKRTVLFASG